MRDQLVIIDGDDVAQGSARRVGQATSSRISQGYQKRFFACDRRRQRDSQVDHRDIIDRNTDRNACGESINATRGGGGHGARRIARTGELAIELWDDELHCAGSTCSGWDDV